ncbi:hypothetical protein HK103_005863 [Boothiomyces macroporosus]|uniref:Oligopeptide transporter n=1 Tax=Boothiomyces macroporosus TaxID=261099 RepID=A0AAD5Y2Z1_9FUNG|nr:hypothetical protein HK103_005863 [Boothiomyces macroporosus]
MIEENSLNTAAVELRKSEDTINNLPISPAVSTLESAMTINEDTPYQRKEQCLIKQALGNKQLFEGENTKKSNFYGIETYSSDDEWDPNDNKRDSDFYGYGPEISFEKENSTIPEVAVTVPIEDDVTMLAFTFRMLLISTVVVATTTSTANFFFFKLNRVYLDVLSVIICAYFIGNGMAKLPKSWTLLNPGPFTHKEHTLIAIASMAASNNIGMNVISLQRLFYGRGNDSNYVNSGIDIGNLSSILFLISTQCIGIGLGGILNKYLVLPAAFWWPETITSANLIHTFHSTVSHIITKYRMLAFFTVFGVGFVYQFLPQFFMPVLQSISILCLAAGGASGKFNPPNEPIVKQHYRQPLLGQMGSSQGGGILSLSLDWTAISFLDPLVTPIWSQANVLFSNYFLAWVVTPILYFMNTWNAKNFPLYMPANFYLNGTKYRLQQFLVNNTLPANEAVPPMWIPPYWAICYGCGFAALSSVIVHYLVHYAANSYSVFFQSTDDLAQKDIHSRLMKRYEPIPLVWYVGCTLTMLMVGVYVTTFNSIGFQISSDFWVIPLALFIAIVFAIPTGIIRSISNQTIDLSIITELIMGVLKPGFPLANATFTVFTNAALQQSLSCAAQMKLAYYMKVPPKAVFVMQLYGTILGCIVNYFSFDYMVRNVPQIWRATHSMFSTNQWSGRSATILQTGSEIFGAISPSRFFDGSNTPYSLLFWFFLIGAALPLVFYIAARFFPRAGLQYVNWPIIFQSAAVVAGGHGNAILSATLVVIGTQYFLRKYKRSFYDKYNYITAAGLDCAATAVPILLYLLSQLKRITEGETHYGWDDISDLIPYYALKPNPTTFGPDYCGGFKFFKGNHTGYFNSTSTNYTRGHTWQ